MSLLARRRWPLSRVIAIAFRCRISLVRSRDNVQVRVMLAGKLNASLERHAQYYEHVHGDSVDTRARVLEIIRALDAERGSSTSN